MGEHWLLIGVSWFAAFAIGVNVGAMWMAAACWREHLARADENR